MQPSDTQLLIAAIDRLADSVRAGQVKTFTITGAADWPMFAFLFAIIAGLIAFMWLDLRGQLKGEKIACDGCKRDIWTAIDRRRDAEKGAS